MRRGKKIAIVCIALLAIGTLVGAVACGKGGGGEEETLYELTYTAGASDASGTPPAVQTYKEGESVTLLGADVYTRTDYTFAGWYDGYADYAAGATYTMPARDVEMSARWHRAAAAAPDGSLQIEAIPESSLVTNVTAAGETAKAHWYAVYGEDGLEVSAYVEDIIVYAGPTIYRNDKVTVTFANVSRANVYTENTVSVSVDPKNNTEVVNLSTGDAAEIEGLTTEANYFTLDGKTLAGYYVKIVMPYTAAGIDEAKKDAALCLKLTNAQSVGASVAAVEDKFGTEENAVHTYIMVTDDNTFAQNTYIELGVFWGNAGSLKMNVGWDLSNDIGKADSSISLNSDANDNFIYMKNSYSTHMYAEVKFTVQGQLMEDGLDKFGLLLTKADGTQFVFYFVDAPASGGTHKADSVVLHYVKAAPNFPSWASDKSLHEVVGKTASVYQGNNYATIGLYRNENELVFTRGEDVIGYTSLVDLFNPNEAGYFGFASFAAKVTLKDYKLVTDETALKTWDDKLAAYKAEEVHYPEKKSDKTIDGDLSDWSAQDKTNPFVYPGANGQSVTIYATKCANGVNIAADIYHSTHNTEATEWYMNTNIEFYVGEGEQRHIAAGGSQPAAGVTDYAVVTDEHEDGALYHTKMEGFIPYYLIAGYDDSSPYIPAQFMFKVGGLFGNVWNTGDWWRTDDGGNRGLLITNQGFAAATDKTIDGSEADWATEGNWTSTASGKAQFKAYFGDDGLYAIIKITGQIANGRAFYNGADGSGNNWWLNQNLEIFEHGGLLKPAKIVYIGGKTYHTMYVTEAAATFTEGGASDVLIYELFIHSAIMTRFEGVESGSIHIGGQLFDDDTSTAQHWNDYISDVTHANQITRKGYTVTFQDELNVNTEAYRNVAKGKQVGNLPNLQKTGWTFDGWYVSGDSNKTILQNTYTPTGDVTLVAKWTPVEPTVTVEKGTGGEAATGSLDVTKTWKEADKKYTLTLPAALTRTDGYTFTKWSVVVGETPAAQYEAGATLDVDPGAQVTVTALWVNNNAEHVTVTFTATDSDNTGYSETVQVETGKSVKVSEGAEMPTPPTKAGYRFDKWVIVSGGTADDPFTEDTVVSAEMTVKATWVQQITVTFKPNGGVGEETTVTIDINTSLGEQLPAELGRGGYTFEGWYLETSDGSGQPGDTKLEATEPLNKNTVAVAKWKDNIDGKLDNWTEEQKGDPIEFTATNGRYIKMYATMDDYGVYILYDALHSKNPTGSGEWWKNTNAEFFFEKANGTESAQFFATATEHSSNLKHVYFNTAAQESLFATKFECFIPYEDLAGEDITKESPYVNMFLAFKINNDAGVEEGDFTQVVGGPGSYIRDFGVERNTDGATYRFSTFVNRNGIFHNEASDLTIDGDLTDWDAGLIKDSAGAKATGVTSLKFGYKKGTDGLYLAFEARAEEIAENDGSELLTGNDHWWENTNLEFFYGTDTILKGGRIVLYQGETIFTNTFDQAKIKITQDPEGEDVLTAEVFISNMRLVPGKTKIDVGGQIFGGGRVNDAAKPNFSFHNYARGTVLTF